MMNLALILAAIALPFVAAAPTAVSERDCGAARFSSGVYYSFYLQVSASVQAKPGQTVKATIVDKATCTPYTGSDVVLQTVIGSAFDRDWDYDPTNGLGFTSVSVNGTNTLSFVAEVPNGGTNLDVSVTAQLTPGNLANFQWAFGSLGVLYTAA